MIIPKLVGRLGNQCFQIAAAIAHAKKMHTDWGVPHKTQDMRLWPMYFRNLPFTRHIPIAHYNEPRHCYDALPLQKDMFLNGYFQSEKYFEEAKHNVAAALGFNKTPTKDFTSLHIRRGDYLHYPNEFPVLKPDYYIKAIARAMQNGYSKFRVYSDDILWCEKFFNANFTVIKFEYSRITSPVADMQDMYNAGAFIIANSTFSLFPAILRTDNPLVIAPAEHRWYGSGNSHLPTCDLMPERFIKI